MLCLKAYMFSVNICISITYKNAALNRPKREYLTVNMPLVNSTVRMIVGINNILLQNTSLRFMRIFLMNRRRSLGPMIALSILFSWRATYFNALMSLYLWELLTFVCN